MVRWFPRYRGSQVTAPDQCHPDRQPELATVPAKWDAGRIRRNSPANEPKPLQVKPLQIDVIERAEEIRLDDHEACAGIAQDVLQLRSARGDVDWHRNRAEPGAAEKALDIFSTIGAHQRHPVAGPNARCASFPAKRAAMPGISSKLKLTSAPQTPAGPRSDVPGASGWPGSFRSPGGESGKHIGDVHRRFFPRAFSLSRAFCPARPQSLGPVTAPARLPAKDCRCRL